MFGSVIEPIKALREATDDLTSQDLSRLFDDQIQTTIAQLSVLESRLAAMRLASVAEADRRRLAEQSPHRSTARWLADTCSISYGQARNDLGLAQHLDAMENTAEGAP